MFQSFDPPPGPENSALRIKNLRAELARLKLDGFLVPRADEHQGEYVPPSAERLSWLTGFTGSAGAAVILTGRAAIFIDGRYVLQVRDQIDLDLIEPVHIADQSLTGWLSDALSDGQRLGFDPWLHTARDASDLKAACANAGAELVPVTANLVDAIWADRPAPPNAPVALQPQALTGRSSAEKRTDIAEQMASEDIDAAVLTAPDSIAWLLNIRGADVPHTPFALSFALLHKDATLEWFIAPEKLSSEIVAALGNGVRIAPPDQFIPALTSLGKKRATLRFDPETAAEVIRVHLTDAGAKLVDKPDPCALPKAKKTPAEVAGARAAHIRDGAAVSNFLAWLSAHAPTGAVTEISAAKQLESYRAATGQLKDLSFDTISGAGPDGAIVHYRVTEATDQPLVQDSLFLVDSGGQYLDGTTDITRTVAIGTPSLEMKENFTRVLRGHIMLAMARFPKGTTGAELDVLARYWLWQAGLNYDHGTGHGVGAYLSVHEGPQGIHKRANKVALEPGMIISNEPGYYKTGAYGIRIENLVTVTALEDIDGGDRPMMGFETLTLAPLDRTLIMADMLSAQERDWLNAYHQRVWEAVQGLVDDETQPWLKAATASI